MSVKKIFTDYIPMAAIAVLIVVFAFINEQTFLATLPTLITLIVQLLLLRANRYVFLLGAGNSALYGLAYLQQGLYFSVINAFALNLPFQVYAFFTWRKNKDDKQSAVLRRLTPRGIVLCVVFLLSSWAISYFGLARFFSDPAALPYDSYLLGAAVVTLVLQALRYSESQYVSSLSCVVSVTMWIAICIEDPAQLNYLFISIYNLYMVARTALAWTKKAKTEQK